MPDSTTPSGSIALEERVRTRRDDIRQLAAAYGVENIRLFGSVARGQSGQGSDVDLLIDPPEHFSLFDQVGLKQDLEDLLDCPVDVVTVESLHWYIRDRVLREAVPV
jgi:predicted nucleotidyltransferase